MCLTFVHCVLQYLVEPEPWYFPSCLYIQPSRTTKEGSLPPSLWCCCWLAHWLACSFSICEADKKSVPVRRHQPGVVSAMKYTSLTSQWVNLTTAHHQKDPGQVLPFLRCNTLDFCIKFLIFEIIFQSTDQLAKPLKMILSCSRISTLQAVLNWNLWNSFGSGGVWGVFSIASACFHDWVWLILNRIYFSRTVWLFNPCKIIQWQPASIIPLWVVYKWYFFYEKYLRGFVLIPTKLIDTVIKVILTVIIHLWPLEGKGRAKDCAMLS